MKDWLSIGDFSGKSRLSVKALRHYEEVGLLAPVSRGENNYRYYSTEQLEVAVKIREYKSLGFSLEEIRNLLQVTQASNLREILEAKLESLQKEQAQLAEQKSAILSILISLNNGQELSTEQRSYVMENLMHTSLEGLKRRGVLPTEETKKKLHNEISNLSPEQQQLLQTVRKVVRTAAEKNILLGPGRGSAGASLILFSEGYLPINPLQFNLIPEFFSGAKYFWMDVEFSRSREIGDLCRKEASEINYQLVAFKCPFLDILQRVQAKTGPIDFDRFEDFSEVMLSAFKQKDLRGIWNFDWTPRFTAFQLTPPEDQKKLWRDQRQFEEWFADYPIESTDDLLNIGFLHDMGRQESLVQYRELKKEKILYPFLKPESQARLHKTHGLILYREDWLRILCDYLPVDIFEALRIFRALAKDEIDSLEFQKFSSIEDTRVRHALQDTCKTVFMKSHLASGFWYLKRTAIMKALWTDLYVQTIEDWEQEKGLPWQEFGYEHKGQRYFEA